MNKLGIGLSIIIIIVFTIMALTMGLSDAIEAIVNGVVHLAVGIIEALVTFIDFLLRQTQG